MIKGRSRFPGFCIIEFRRTKKKKSKLYFVDFEKSAFLFLPNLVIRTLDGGFQRGALKKESDKLVN